MPFSNPLMPSQFDVGLPNGGHIHFDSTGIKVFADDGVSIILELDTQQAIAAAVMLFRGVLDWQDQLTGRVQFQMFYDTTSGEFVMRQSDENGFLGNHPVVIQSGSGGIQLLDSGAGVSVQSELTAAGVQSLLNNIHSAANLVADADVTAAGKVTAGTTVTAGTDVTATGDVHGTNVLASNDVTATNNVTGAAVAATGPVSAGATVTAGGNIHTTGGEVVDKSGNPYPHWIGGSARTFAAGETTQTTSATTSLVTVAHGLGVVPLTVTAIGASASGAIYKISSKSAANFVLEVRSGTNALIPLTSVTFDWIAFG